MSKQGLKIDLKLPFDRKVDLPKKESSILSKKTDNEETKKDFSSSTEDSKSTTTFEGLETLESLISSELAESSDKFLNLLVQTNDRAISGMTKENAKDALVILEKIERVLEFAASTGKTLDRNLVIVVLYNIASAYQCNWSLEKCSRYIDGVIFNLQDSSNNEPASLEALIAQQAPKEQIQSMKSIRLRKQHFLLKVYLQHCAVLSQLSKHEQALVLIKKAAKLLNMIVEEVYDECLQMKTSMDVEMMKLSKAPNANKLTGDEYFSISVNDAVFREEIHYNRVLLDAAIPFLSEFLKTVGNFSLDNPGESYNSTKRAIYNWKNNPENNEKHLRKEFQKDASVTPAMNENRSLLGVQQTNDWLEDFNIGSIMHMKPLKYKDYAKKREFIKEITKESLQEHVIYMSLILFTTATEMRFIEMAQSGETKKNPVNQKVAAQLPSEGFKKSEAYHLKAIELVCKYINGPCPYVNHLISSYHKHYKQNLDTILEESFVSVSDTKSITREVFDADDKSLSNQLDELFARKSMCEERADTIVEPTGCKSNTEKKDRVNFRNFEIKNGNQPQNTQLHFVSESQKVVSSSACKPTEKTKLGNQEEDPFDQMTPRDGRAEEAVKKDNPSTSPRYYVKKEFSTPVLGNSSKKIKSEANKSERVSTSETGSLNPGYVSERLFRPNQLLTESQDLPSNALKESSGLKAIKVDKQTRTVRGPQTYKDISAQNRAKKTSPPNINNKSATNSQSIDKPGINFFFYKNFNKFIQNLYVQDEKQLKLQSQEAKDQERLFVSKKLEASARLLAASKAKDEKKTASQPLKIEERKAMTPIGNSQGIALSGSKSQNKKTTQITKNSNMLAGESKRVESSGGLRRQQNEMTKSVKTLRPDTADGQENSNYASRMVKSSSVKQIPMLEFSKLRLDTSKEKKPTQSPRA